MCFEIVTVKFRQMAKPRNKLLEAFRCLIMLFCSFKKNFAKFDISLYCIPPHCAETHFLLKSTLEFSCHDLRLQLIYTVYKNSDLTQIGSVSFVKTTRL